MTRERILTTRPDGSVVITCPAEPGILYLMHGATGPWHPWFGQPIWFGAVQFSRMVMDGIRPEIAYKFAHAMVNGGLTREQAIATIAARDCEQFGTAIEIVDVSEVPTDWTYRNAWRRSHNGGPIWVCEDAIREIEEQRMWTEHERA